nr:Golgi apparatus protein 1 isoform X1 [Onthophagus taurus]
MKFLINFCLVLVLITCSRVNGDVSSIIMKQPSCIVIKQFCSTQKANDFQIIECILSDPSNVNRLDSECQHVVWEQISEIISNKYVREFLSPLCENDHSFQCEHTDPSSEISYLKCAINVKNEISVKDCVNTITRFENIAFDDLKWISNFLKHCNTAVEKFKCGRLTGDSSSQGETLSCLQNYYREIDSECQREIMELSEIQSDNIKLDRQLYMACATDHMHYCSLYSPGSGKVFKCLMQHYNDHLDEKCRNHLLKRQKLIMEDYRLSKGLMRTCKDDIKKYHCRRQTSEDKSIRLAQVLLCLENVMKNGTKIDNDCENEMKDHRRILMEDFRLSPEIVDGCSLDIKKFCNNLEVGGKTLHCLMEHARVKNTKKIRDSCQRALEKLIKETDAAEDWRVDPVLHDACITVVKVACNGIKAGEARVMTCLLDNIGNEVMTDECEDALFQIQYFVARDFKLDPQLYKACRDDANRFCHAGKEWEDPTNHPESGPLVLPCLYRYAYGPNKDMKLKPKCFEQVKRVMRQRALNVDLHPEIEENCLEDLAMHCFEKTGKGEELQCLQLNLEKVSDVCKKTIEEFTEDEAQHIELNPYIMKNCKNEMNQLCDSELGNEDGDVMSCLISHKNEMTIKRNNKCKISIEHFQIISLKDYRFSYKFKMACKRFALQFCQNEKSKAGVVTCLSEKVLNDTMMGIKSEIQKDCRQQLRAQLFLQRESINNDPKLYSACKDDVKKFCGNVPADSAQVKVLECLQSTQDKLSETCQVELFKIKREEIADNTVDYALVTNCEDSIDQFCPKTEREHVLDCLKKNRDEKGFNKKCRTIVIHRMIEQNSDYRLNPGLHENCQDDIKKYCSEIVARQSPDHELNGKVIGCLRDSFRRSRLSNRCEKEMTDVLRQQALDLRLNPLLRVVCKNELSTICQIDEDDSRGTAEECLKNALLKKQIHTKECQDEIVYMIEESQADINADPLLHEACALDLLKYCSEIPQGSGRHIKCLKYVLADPKNKPLTDECANMFKTRIEMYKQIDYAAPENLVQLYSQVALSPAKHYFLFLIFLVISSMLMIGIFCGRVTKRHMLLKNK